jgi:hypothetical protein
MSNEELTLYATTEAQHLTGQKQTAVPRLLLELAVRVSKCNEP